MADILEIAFQTVTTFPFNVIIIIAIVAYVAYYILTMKKGKGEGFIIEDFRESVFTSTEKLINLFGSDVDAFLVRGVEYLGRITKYYHHKGAIEHGYPENTTKMILKKGKQENKVELVDIWIFKIGNSGIIEKIFGGKVDYLAVKDEHLNEFNPHKKQFSIKENVSFTPYGGIFITSQEGEDYANDISFRRSQEEILTHLQNFPRKVAYLELGQAKILEKIKSSIEDKNLGYEFYKKNVLTSNKDLEDEDED